MEAKFCVLTMLEASPLQLATVRSLLAAMSKIYIEVEDNFYISCSNNFLTPFNELLLAQQLKFIMVFVNNQDRLRRVYKRNKHRR